MPVNNTYRTFILGQLAPLVPLRERRMFGCLGLYADDLLFGLVSGDTLYLKVDQHNLPDYQAAGVGPFAPYGDKRPMPYYAVPIEVQEDRAELRAWVEKAVDAARRRKGREA
ncbi:MAG TPA: TfoX/Sxy family protein [Roseiflexaceae bacterium]|nr:TfoX/Sxy family protein [Roseiflexaceae bacterium]